MAFLTNRNFLGIPPSIRQRIYFNAGVVIRGYCLALAPRDTSELLPRIPAEEICNTYSLLQTCKVVHQEVLTLICAHNTLALVHDHIDYGLRFLGGLSPQHVSIHLAVAARSDPPPRSSGKALLTGSRLASWLSTARHVLSNTNRNLNLQLFCHTGADSITSAVLQPFQDFPGRLRDCHIELDNQKGESHFEVQDLAREAVNRAKGFDPSLRSSPFRFFDLPFEIRQQILMLTDLVTPFNEIYWSAKNGFMIKRVFNECSDEPMDYAMNYIHSRTHHACPFLFCNSNASSIHGYPTYSCCKCTGYVCCQDRSGYSSRCKCWSDPTSLLIANRQLYHEAIQILYSCNRIIILPSGDFRTAIGPISKRLDISAFITRHMWPEALQHLRNLECVFPAINPLYADMTCGPYFLDYCFALDHLASKADLSKLTVAVYLTVLSSVLTDDKRWFQRELRLRDTHSALRAHTQLLEPFSKLRGMKAFYAYLEWGWRFSIYTVKEQFRPNPSIADLNGEIDSLELSLEQMIMGREYDPIGAGKLQRRPSSWLFKLRITFWYFGWSLSA
ncbi:hypothetical protein F4777DRAFT_592668 [Nemania sp. FL0916]|nr:hypothetical protein F4777DRAFT_592668 [Nemania sp. FL0916]